MDLFCRGQFALHHPQVKQLLTAAAMTNSSADSLSTIVGDRTLTRGADANAAKKGSLTELLLSRYHEEAKKAIKRSAGEASNSRLMEAKAMRASNRDARIAKHQQHSDLRKQPRKLTTDDKERRKPVVKVYLLKKYEYIIIKLKG